MIRATKLGKYYGGYLAVRDVSFEIGDGAVVGLLGLNGAGKTTILKMLGCLLLPTAGTAEIDGFTVTTDPYEVRRRIGFLPELPPLYPEMTVRAFLRFAAKLHDVAAQKLTFAVEMAAEKTNLTDVLDVRVGELSHGYRQRVGIAQAVVHEPRVMILDEPMRGLDPVQIVEMRDLVLSLRGRHTIILSSHILGEITKTCDRLLVIDKGRLIADGTEAEIERRVSTRHPQVVCETATWSDETAAALAKIPGVAGVKVVSPNTASTRTIEVATQSDVRAEIARCLVNSGVGLLGLQSRQTGLEDTFLKLVNLPTEAQHGR